MSPKKAGFLLLLLVLLALNIVLACVFFLPKKEELTVSFLNVGQGDAILIESPTGEQILIDGGPDRSVLRQLPREIGPLDRSIDLVIATHPDKDHIAGLADVFRSYRVGGFMEPDVSNDTSYAHALTHAASVEKGVVQVKARRGMRAHIGGGAYMDILFPDREVDRVESNTGSIVLRLVYGKTEFMLTGDAPSSVEDWLVALEGGELRSDVLKAGHHGSRTSTSDAWVEAVRPSFAVVSAGKGNSYGHPHTEVIERLQASGAQILSTMDGPVRFKSDGTRVIED